ETLVVCLSKWCKLACSHYTLSPITSKVEDGGHDPRRPRRGARLCRRWALQWREDGQLLGQYLRTTKCEKLSDTSMLNKAPYGRTLRSSALSSGTGSLRA